MKRIVIAILGLFLSTSAFAQYLTPAVNSPLFPSTPSAGQIPFASSPTGADWGTPTANPTGAVGLAGINGSATSFMRSDAAPPLSSSVQSALTGTNAQVLVGTGIFGFSSLTNTQLTALINVFSSSLPGSVPASGGGTANFLRADGTFAPPSNSAFLLGSLATFAGAL